MTAPAGRVGLSEAQREIGRLLRAALDAAGCEDIEGALRAYARAAIEANRERAARRPTQQDAGLGRCAYIRRWGTPAERQQLREEFRQRRRSIEAVASTRTEAAA